jgi:signal transduction histidine kinase
VAFLTLYRGEGLRALLEDESPSELLQALARDRLALSPTPRLVLTERLEAPPPTFWYFDARLLRLALDAALDNACRYAHGTVWLEAAERDGALVFAIEDDGPGFAATAEAAAARRGDSESAARAGWNTGLGTELCRAVARAHVHQGRSGAVHLLPRAGGGARFELVIP